MSTETGTVLLTSLVPPAAMGLIVGKNTSTDQERDDGSTSFQLTMEGDHP